MRVVTVRCADRKECAGTMPDDQKGYAKAVILNMSRQHPVSNRDFIVTKRGNEKPN